MPRAAALIIASAAFLAPAASTREPAPGSLALYVSALANDSIVKLVDLDGDDTFQGPGEAAVAYDPLVAASSGGVVIDFPRTIGFAVVTGPPVPGDITGDGAVDLADLNLVLANFGTGA